MNNPEPTPVIEVTIAAPVETVWDALRNHDTIRHWHGWDFDGLDEEIDLIYFKDFVEDADARTLEIQGGDRISLQATPDGTLLRLVRAPIGDDTEWAAYYDDITEGWTTFLHQLRFAVERHPGVARRTIFLDGAAGATSPADELGLDGATTTLLGESVSTAPWFRSEHQIGVTVDAWGDGLLVVTRVPDKGAMAVLTTYGLGDEAFSDLESRWRRWWTEHHPPAPEA